MTHEEIIHTLSDSYISKPDDLIIDSLQWKYLNWAVLRGKNILFVGPTRCGKTKAARSIAKVYEERPFFYFNLGSTQDARATLIGNTVFQKDEGTIFFASEFVKAIQTPQSIILLDELSRGHHDAWNILMTVLDTTQNYLRLDETKDSAIVKVAQGVTFIATANVGNEYTSTRVMDKALTSRFPVILEMKILSAKQEEGLLNTIYKDVTKEQASKFTLLSKLSEETKKACRADNPKITNYITTDGIIEMGGLVLDGFTLSEIVEMTVYPLYADDNGEGSERLFVKQLVQKYVDVSSIAVTSPIRNSSRVRIPMDS